MAQFQYEARDSAGLVRSGTMHAASMADVAGQLRAGGLSVDDFDGDGCLDLLGTGSQPAFSGSLSNGSQVSFEQMMGASGKASSNNNNVNLLI